MSKYDDCMDGSGTTVYGNHWVAAVPNAHGWQIGFLHTMLLCEDCGAYLDALDMSIGNFGDLHCIFCGSDHIVREPDEPWED